MTVYTLHCTLCKGNYSKITDWNEHLVNSSHQKSARHGLSRWDNSTKHCGVVIYSRVNLFQNFVKSVVPVLMESMTNGVSVLITDLILSPVRPGVGIIQFEKREKVDQLFSVLKDCCLKIDNQLYQFRRVGKLLELEWEELLVSSFNIELPNIPNQEDDNGTTKCTMATADFMTKYDNPADAPLSCQVNSVLKQVEIPDEEFSIVENVIKEVQQILEETSSSTPCIVEMFRYNYLKLKNSPTNRKYWIFMYIPTRESTGYTIINSETELKLFHQIEFIQKNSASKSILQKLDTKFDSSTTDQPNQHTDRPFNLNKVTFVHRELGLEFRLTTYPYLMPSLQLSRLVTYYCQFDPRVKPLLALLYYWAKVNKIQVSAHNNALVKERTTRQSGHVTLEWLFLTFLFHKEKIIPVPRLIFNRPHQKISFVNSGKTDVGFTEDKEFVRNWQKEVKSSLEPLDILTVFKNFFEFCSEMLGPGKHIINTRDGEILSSENWSKMFTLYTPGKLVSSQSQMFGEHLTESDRDYLSNHSQLIGQNIIIISNPFKIRWKLVVDSEIWFKEVYPVMQKTGKQLYKFLNDFKSRHCISQPLESVLICEK